MPLLLMEEMDVAVQAFTKAGLFIGPQRGIVTDNKDPEERGRIQAVVPTAQDEALKIWIDPSFDGASNQQGEFHPPPIGAAVWIDFENCHPEKPIRYTGGWYGSAKVGDLPVEFSPDPETHEPRKSGKVTRAGHTFVFNDTPGQETVRCTWHKPADGDKYFTDPSAAADRTTGETAFFAFQPDGSFQVASADGSQLMLDVENAQIMAIAKDGSLISIGKEGIKMVHSSGRAVVIGDSGTQVVDPGQVTVQAQTAVIQAGSVFLGPDPKHSIPLGEPLIKWLATHTHPTGVGPSGTPVEPPSTELLSKNVKL